MDSAQDQTYAEFLEARRAVLLRKIAQAAHRSGRDEGDITLLAVSKTVGPEQVALAHSKGYLTFGENRPQELRRKVSALMGRPEFADVHFHMIGNLQTNKINQVLGNATLIHSVSSAHLAEAISQRAAARGKVARCLLEVNVSGEESKSGFSPMELPAVADAVMALDGIALEGLMTMAPAGDDVAARRTFSGLRDLAEDLRARTGLELPVLSCGMSGDFEIAIEEGSTLVRLGRIVFDPSYAVAGE